MASEQLVNEFRQIADLVRSSTNPSLSWSRILEITGFNLNASLSQQPIDSDITSLAGQVREIFRAEPIPAEIDFLWFGLFDLRKSGRDLEACYVSGWEGSNPDNGREIYIPKARYLFSELLNGIKSGIERRARAGLSNAKDLAEYHELDYAIMFGAAALLSRFTITNLSIRLPVYVGFDSGDWALVANTPKEAGLLESPTYRSSL